MDNKKRRELISERLDKEEKFNSCKSYNALWKKIQKKSGRRRNICDILSSNEQVEKFEKRYKEVVDNNSKMGKEKCT